MAMKPDHIRSSWFARLQQMKCAIADKNLYTRFTCSTGDAMGMNMISKGVQNVLEFLTNDLPDMDVIGISGNYYSDKKPTAVHWIEGRGKSAVWEVVLKEEVVKKVLKTNVASLVELSTLKMCGHDISKWREMLFMGFPDDCSAVKSLKNGALDPKMTGLCLDSLKKCCRVLNKSASLQR